MTQDLIVALRDKVPSIDCKHMCQGALCSSVGERVTVDHVVSVYQNVAWLQGEAVAVELLMQPLQQQLAVLQSQQADEMIAQLENGTWPPALQDRIQLLAASARISQAVCSVLNSDCHFPRSRACV